ncbi:MAG: flagellar biosynthesis protein FlhF [Bacillales bacterium]|jgi:flagellar biosynthesis protein FlhF|nr:flagellar biosynthesis protein FlhF [Bacillales bacterium]
MKVKKIVAPTMPEAMKIVKEQLGNDAIILNSKVVEVGGFLGFFKRKSIEVIAAIDEAPPISKKIEAKDQKQKFVPIVNISETKQDNKPLITSVNNNIKESNNEEALLQEIKELKQLLTKSSNQKDELTNKDVVNINHPIISDLYNLLIKQEIEKSIADRLIKKVQNQWTSSLDSTNQEKLLNVIKNELLNEFSKIDFGGISFSKKYINVVGPTGVGKTTTLAKIAAQCVLKFNKRVAFITTDTYRIAAIEQLKTYAKILGVPIEVCYNLEDFKAAKEKFNEYDLVFIDTAGRNFRNKEYVEELTKIIDYSEEVETYLVLAVTSKYLDMVDIYNQFSIIPINKLIFTKVDETRFYGSILNLIINSSIGIGYITNGQNVPDDIIESTPLTIVNLIIEGLNNERSS